MTDGSLDEIFMNAGMDELLSILDSCEHFFWAGHERASDEEFAGSISLKQRVVSALKSKYGLHDEGIREAWREWNERTLKQAYDNSLCSGCERSPGYENYKSCGGTLHCRGDDWFSMVYSLSSKDKKNCNSNAYKPKQG